MRYLKVLVALALIVVGAPALVGQTFPVPIAQAIALLTSGTTPFAIVGINANGYINFDTGRSASGYGFRANNGIMEVKNSGGSWSTFTTSGGAPSTATYITQTSNAGLSAEQALSGLASALLLNTTSTGVLTAYAGSSCTNQFVRSLSALGAATCAAVTLTTDVTGTLPAANGGTGAATLTGVLIGNGTSAFTAATSSTVGQVLRVTGANTYALGAVNLADTDAITGVGPVANGFTGLTSGTSGGVLAFTASGTIASSGALTVSRIVLGGGAGAAPTVLGSLGTTTTVLHGNAAGAPTFAAVDIAADTTGTMTVARGGTNIASYTIGDVIYASGTTTLSKLAASTAGTFLRAAGAGTAPAWSTTVWTNSATTGDLLQATGSNTYGNLTAVAAGSYLRSGGVTTASVWSTLKLPNAATAGDLIVATAADTLGSVTAVATGRVLISAGTGTVPSWSTTPSAATFTASTSFTGPGTAAAAGVVRLANTSTIAARNVGNSADIVLAALTSTDAVQSGLIFTRHTTPTISSGFGTTPSIAGVASAFKVTVGGGGDTAGVVLFTATWSTAPVCIGQNQTTSQAVRATPTTTQVTLTGTFAASDVLSVWCVGY